MPIIIYADGSCLGNPGPGGYAAVIIALDGSQRQIVGSKVHTTNSRMELMAAIVGLEAFQEHHELRVHSDSEYVIKGMTEWIEGWKRRRWRNANNKPIKNKDLWERLERAAEPHTVEWIWIRGHDGDPMNELADRWAKEAAEREARLLVAAQ